MANKKSGIKRNSAGYGHDLIQWKTATGRVEGVRAVDSASVMAIEPGQFARIPPKFRGQRNYHGSYWCVGIGDSVRYESMAECFTLMLLDYLYELAGVAGQPVLLTFENGKNHVPDYLVTRGDGSRVCIDVHPEEKTSAEDLEKFALTAALCDRVGWGYELFDSFDRQIEQNLTWIGRYRHPRYAPTEETRDLILRAWEYNQTVGQLREAIRTEKPGEHVPALYHLMWNRELLVDLTFPFTDQTELRSAEFESTIP